LSFLKDIATRTSNEREAESTRPSAKSVCSPNIFTIVGAADVQSGAVSYSAWCIIKISFIADIVSYSCCIFNRIFSLRLEDALSPQASFLFPLPLPCIFAFLKSLLGSICIARNLLYQDTGCILYCLPSIVNMHILGYICVSGQYYPWVSMRIRSRLSEGDF